MHKAYLQTYSILADAVCMRECMQTHQQEKGQAQAHSQIIPPLSNWCQFFEPFRAQSQLIFALQWAPHSRDAAVAKV